MKSNSIIHGRTPDDLPKQERYDVVIADPPYNIGKDFGNNKDKMPEHEYLKWSQEWIGRCLMQLRPGGMLYCYGSPEQLAKVAALYPTENQRWLIWHYTNKTTPGSRFWQRSHESILALWREKRPRLAVDVIREPYSEHYMKCAGRRRNGTASRFGSGRETTYNAHPEGALPRDVLHAPALAGGAGAKERWFFCKDCGVVAQNGERRKHDKHKIVQHPTQKPVSINKRLIQSVVGNRRGKVLVPFCGSGSEAVAAAELGCTFTALEINKDYIRIAKKRIGRVQ